MMIMRINEADIETNRRDYEEMMALRGQKDEAIKEGLKYRPDLRKAYEELRITRIDGDVMEIQEAYAKYAVLAEKRHQAEHKWEEELKIATNRYIDSCKSYGSKIRDKARGLWEEIQGQKFIALIKKDRNIVNDSIVVTYRTNIRFVNEALTELMKYIRIGNGPLFEIQKDVDELDEFLSNLDIPNGEVLTCPLSTWEELYSDYGLNVMTIKNMGVKSSTTGYMVGGKIHDLKTGQRLES